MTNRAERFVADYPVPVTVLPTDPTALVTGPVGRRKRPTQPEVAAAMPTHTGAMIALVPSDADIARLAVDGGEPANELHLTLAYLGDAADIPADIQAQILDMCAHAAATMQPLDVHGFGLSAFNPHDPDVDTALVMGVGGDGLAEADQSVTGQVSKVMQMPKQHTPFVPHVTLAYSDDLGMLPGLVGKLGPVTFDRMRVAFGGETTDFPLAGMIDVDGTAYDVTQLREYWVHGKGALKIRWPQPGAFMRCVREIERHAPTVTDPKGLCAEYYHEAKGIWPGANRHHTVAAAGDMPDAAQLMPGEMPMPTMEEMDAALAEEEALYGAYPDAHFHTLMHTEGVSTGMRVQMPGSLTWRQPPIPLNWEIETAMHGGLPKVVEVGAVTDIARMGREIHGWGLLDLADPTALEYARKLAQGWIRGVSIGLDEQPVDQETLYSPADPTKAVQEVYRSGNIYEVTSSGGVAQASAYIEPLPALLDALTALGINVASAAEDCGCPDAQAPVS